MGLMDVLNGMKNGPRGAPAPSGTTGGSTGGMSPLTLGLLAYLAYKALKGGGILGSGAAQPQPGPAPYPGQSPGGVPGRSEGGAGDWLSGLGGLLAGGAAGSVLTGGLGELLKKFQQTGQGEVAQSWVGTGPNKAITPGDLERAVGVDTLDALARQSGMPRDQLLTELTKQLPATIDSLTPQGRIPSEQEASRWA